MQRLFLSKHLKMNVRGRYSKISYTQKTKFFDSPSTSAQDVICTRTNDTSQDTEYPSKKYKCTKNLGEGSASTIYKGIIISNNQEVIIKKISKKECWRKELEVLKLLQNSTSGRILKYVGYYESQRSSFLVTEYYTGFDLFEHIDINVPYSKKKGLRIIREMAQCIKECHDNNIVHLDIKCENYMVKTDSLFKGDELIGQIILIDFGHAEVFKETESIEKLRRGYNYGTSYYLCPEGYYENIFSSASDIWSLGVCLSIILTGDHPFLGSEKEYYRNSINLDIQFSIDIPDDCSDLITKCLSVNPKHRPNITEFISQVSKIIKNNLS